MNENELFKEENLFQLKIIIKTNNVNYKKETKH